MQRYSEHGVRKTGRRVGNENLFYVLLKWGEDSYPMHSEMIVDKENISVGFYARVLIADNKERIVKGKFLDNLFLVKGILKKIKISKSRWETRLQ